MQIFSYVEAIRRQENRQVFFQFFCALRVQPGRAKQSFCVHFRRLQRRFAPLSDLYILGHFADERACVGC